ncbi:hypothetical protein KEM56_002044 [Ascosphaera pollenicola]|nr:hypothetical protein KEM56_002044 [Ascosphaera pollenicola]
MAEAVSTTITSAEPVILELSEEDRKRFQERDEDFVYQTWDDIKNIIAQNNLAALRRTPSELRKYRVWSANIKMQYGSVVNYIVRERLHWPPVDDMNTQVVNPIPFADERDYKILRNDWPYGFVPGISHMVVWLKNNNLELKEDGDLTDEARKLCDDFVREKFTKRLKPLFDDAPGRVLWFKNWAALQSVKALQHIHVMVRDVPQEIITEWTGEEHLKR